MKEKEVEWALLFSHGLKKEAEQYGYPIVEVEKQEKDLIAVLKALQIDLTTKIGSNKVRK